MISLLLLFSLAATPSAPTVDAGFATAHLAEKLAELSMRPDVAGLAVAVVSRDLVLYQQCYGVRRVGNPATVDPRTRFRVASLSKGFSSTIAAMMVAEGELRWEDQVSKDLDYFTLHDRGQRDQVNVEHLLSHRLGLPPNAYDRLLEADWTPRNIIERYRQVPLLCPVGTCYSYQNMTYNLIADIVTRRAGDPFERQLAERVFAPLKMTRAGLGDSHLREDENHAWPHVLARGKPKWVDIKPHYYLVPASAGVNLSLEDMIRWMQAQLGGAPEVLTGELLSELRRPLVETRREITRGGWRGRRVGKAWYGLGWRIYDYAGHRMIYHAGAVEGYRAQIAIFPDENVAVAVMWNSESGKPWGVVPTFADALWGLPAEDWMKLGSAGSTVLTQHKQP